MMRFLVLLLTVAALFVAAVWSSNFRLPGNLSLSPIVITKETDLNVVLYPVTGQVHKTLIEPGLTWIFPGSRVITLDRRLQHLNAEPVDVVISGKETLITDYYALWRVVDARAFIDNFPQVQSDAAFGMNKAQARVQEAVNGLVKARVAGLELSELLKRNESLDRLAGDTRTELAETGVEVVEVRINRTDLPVKALESAYAQMREQQRALAREYRVRGERKAREARAIAEREARNTLAEAHAFNERTRGEGDAEAARTYSDAYNADAEFYAFVRSLEAYRKTLGEGTTMVLPPDHAFFRFLGKDGQPR